MKSPKSIHGNCLTTVLVLLVIAGIGFYILSVSIQSKVTSMYEAISTWSPERIQKDPAGYLKSATAELNTLEQRCNTEEIRLRAKLAETQRRIVDSRSLLEIQEQDIQSLSSAYKAAVASGNWPLEYGNKRWEKVNVEDELLRLDALAKANRDILPALEKAAAAIPLILPQIAERKREIESLKIRVQTARDIVDVVALSSSQREIQAQAAKIGDYSSAVQAVASAQMPSADSTQVRAEERDRATRLNAIIGK